MYTNILTILERKYSIATVLAIISIGIVAIYVPGLFQNTQTSTIAQPAVPVTNPQASDTLVSMFYGVLATIVVVAICGVAIQYFKKH